MKPNQSLFSDLRPPGITQVLSPAALSGSSKGCSVIDGFSFTWEGQYTSNVAQTVSGAHVVNEESVGNRVSLGLTRRSILTQDAPSPDDDDHEDEFVIPAEFCGYQYGEEGPKRFGTLRKFSSLDFDTDTLESAPSSRQMDSLATNPPVSHQLRKSRSSYMSSFMQSQSTAGVRNKLRKKTRPESATIPAYVQHAMLDLPPGIEQIGNGIGYVRRSKPIHARLSFATLTPRSCHGMFSGTRFPRLAPRHERKKNGNGDYFEHAGSGVSVMGGTRDSEDQMDAVMREMYGSRWNLGTSASELSLAGGADPRVYATLTRTAVGLGLGATALDLTRTRLPTAPAELSTLSPDSTLRLVSPSTLHLVYC
ncbi:uncharacterized protein LAESUDRAFT_568684 [Laetiporus sulphureus 93-53]|uniref:Uncharacterized protein n=1 Tax=Laetiporus sulphureus 93-53 TaxID=1314785 RepID=A0A165FHL4_9APHY|nr:uncharacterized protein LAESUDRAFT_568684 [Laetiporus sulphureus 93-53]KZT08984.1 hypothetical protein LAESUDRAFT_568684 [Laetiporus sulphureus 93-53]